MAFAEDEVGEEAERQRDGDDDRGRDVRPGLAQQRQAGAFDTALPMAAIEPTLFGRFGNIIPILLGFALLIAGIALGRRRRYPPMT